MANDCIFDAVVRGSKKEIELFYDRCLEAKRTADGAQTWWTYEVLREHGYNRDAIRERIGYIGGSLDNINEPTKSGKEYVLTLNMTTRWSPMIEAFGRMLGNYATLRAVYYAEEPGMGIYINTDVSGRDISVRCCIGDYDDDGCGTEYFDTDKQAIEFIKDTYGKNIKSLPKGDDAEIKINKTKTIYFNRFTKH